MTGTRYSRLSEGQKFKAKARSKANLYQRRGHLRPEPCDRCGGTAQKHHPDYSLALVVQWLCEECHRRLHEAERHADRAQLTSRLAQITRSLEPTMLDSCK